MSVSVKFNTAAVIDRFDKECRKRMMRAARVVTAYAKDLIRIPYPPASSPGEPPHRRTGRLLTSVEWKFDRQIIRIGSQVEYAKYLEFGTSKMAARPWLRRALIEKTPEIKKIMGG